MREGNESRIDRETVVTRDFPLELEGEALDAALAVLRDTAGVLKAAPRDGGRPGLHLVYDTRRITASGILSRLEAAGVAPPKRRLARWRLSLIDMLDGNVRDNATHRAACCSRPPPGAGRR